MNRQQTRPSRSPPWWVPVRTLGDRHRPRVLQHLLAMSPSDRMLRFGYMASDEHIDKYVAQIDFHRDEVFGVFDRRLQLAAVAHLAFAKPAGAEADGTAGADADSAEFGVSVVARHRGRGLGARLFEHAATHARNRGVGTLLVYMARDNAPMMALVRRSGAAISLDGSEGIARLALPADTLGTQLGELLAHQAAEFDYRLKQQTLRLNAWNPLA